MHIQPLPIPQLPKQGQPDDLHGRAGTGFFKKSLFRPSDWGMRTFCEKKAIPFAIFLVVLFATHQVRSAVLFATTFFDTLLFATVELPSQSPTRKFPLLAQEFQCQMFRFETLYMQS